MHPRITGRIEGKQYVFRKFKCPCCEIEAEWRLLVGCDTIQVCPANCGQAFLLEVPETTAPITLSPVTV